MSSITPTRSALLGCLTAQFLGAITCVADGHEHPLDGHCSYEAQGLAQVWPRRNRRYWDLAFMAPGLSQDACSVSLWHALLSHLILLGVSRQVSAIYARTPEDPEVEDTLRQAGFTRVTREEVFCLRRRPEPVRRPTELFHVEPEDRWELERFHRQVMPPLVQKAEEPVTEINTLPTIPFRALDVEECVWSHDGEILAWLRLSSGAQGHWLDMVVRPQYRAEVLPFVRYMLTCADVSESRPLYCSVPDYCVGLGWLLRTLGLNSYTRQSLLVAHTAARVPICRPVVIPSLEHGVDVGPPVTSVAPAAGNTGAKLTA